MNFVCVVVSADGHEDLTSLAVIGRVDQPALPVDRGGTGSKHHLITDATCFPLAVTLTGGNRNDVTQLIPLLEAVFPVRGIRGRPRRRPDVVLGDRDYDCDKYRRLVRKLGVTPRHRPPGHRARLWPGHPTLGRGSCVRTPALVPPPAEHAMTPTNPSSPSEAACLLATPEVKPIGGLKLVKLIKCDTQ